MEENGKVLLTAATDYEKGVIQEIQHIVGAYQRCLIKQLHGEEIKGKFLEMGAEQGFKAHVTRCQDRQRK